LVVKPVTALSHIGRQDSSGMHVANRKPPPPRRSGEHPFDTRLAGANLFGWVSPLSELLQRQFPILLVAGLLGSALQLLLPQIAVSSPVFEARLWPRLVDAFVALTLTSGLFAGVYAVLASSEGRPYGLGATQPGGSIFLKATGLALVWTGVGIAIALALGILAYAVFKSLGGGFNGGGIASLLLLGTIGLIGLVIVLLAFAPFWVGLGIRYSLSFARIVRTEEGPVVAFRLAWQRVSTETWRYFWPSYAVMLVFIGASMLLAMASRMVGDSQVLAWILSVLGFSLSLALAFIVERVYDTSLGCEPGVEAGTIEPKDATPSTNSGGGGVGGAVAADSPKRAVSARSAASTDSPGPQVTPSGFAALLEQHAYPERELVGLLARCADLDASLVAARPQLLSLAQGPRLTEAVILVEAALKSDARFFAPTPDLVTPLSKRVASGGRPDLALKILQPFVRENRDHKLHLSAALFAALLLAEHLKKPDVAKQFLRQLKQLYPDEQFIDQQLKRLAP
jgi:hypothetical protein